MESQSKSSHTRTKWEDLALASIKKQFDVFILEDSPDGNLATAIIRVSLEKTPIQIELIMIGVNHENRRKGLCRDVVDYIEQYCSRSGKRFVIVDVLSSRLKAMLIGRGYRKSGKSYHLLPDKRLHGANGGKQKSDFDGQHPA